MPRRSLLTMGAHVLIDLPEQVGTEVAKRRVQLEQQLAQIGKAAGIGRRPGQRRRSSLRGGKVPPKYRGAWRRDLGRPRRSAALVKFIPTRRLGSGIRG
jgi:hypothetical protein